MQTKFYSNMINRQSRALFKCTANSNSFEFLNTNFTANKRIDVFTKTTRAKMF